MLKPEASILSDHDALQAARSWFENLCPSADDRRFVIQRLKQSIEVAETISKTVWSITQTEKGFRLNVGPVEVFTFQVLDLGGARYFQVRMLLHGHPPDSWLMADDECEHWIDSSHYKSVPQPQFIYMGVSDFSDNTLMDHRRDELIRLTTLLQPLHASFINQAAHTPTGAVRTTSNFYKSHSVGLALYLRAFNSLFENKEEHFSTPPEGTLTPMQTKTVSTDFVRSEAVREWVLARAKGVCENCQQHAPFVSDENVPYLEVHHLKPLAQGGSDRVSNTVALCPNCHRAMHFGKDRALLKTALLRKIAELQSE